MISPGGGYWTFAQFRGRESKYLIRENAFFFFWLDVKKAKISRVRKNAVIELKRCVESYALKLLISVEQHTQCCVRARGYDVVCVGN